MFSKSPIGVGRAKSVSRITRTNDMQKPATNAKGAFKKAAAISKGRAATTTRIGPMYLLVNEKLFQRLRMS